MDMLQTQRLHLRTLTLIPLSVLCALALLFTRDASGDNGDPLMITTPNGRLHGFTDGIKNSFLGIPFAASTAGNNRWRPPVPVTPWNGVLDATHFGNFCTQWNNGPPHWNYNRRGEAFTQTDQFGNEFQVGKPVTVIGSEDCLNVNVYTPPTATPGSKLPVLVYLFPGGNVQGDNREDLTAYVNAGLVVVAPNYRLDIFGLIGLPAIVFESGGVTSPNVLLYDVESALKWVHDNIAAFGGDPNNITLTGASAGSADTEATLANPRAKGLFQKAIVATAGNVPFRLEDALLFGATITSLLGCDQARDVPACLRSQSFEAVSNAWFQVWNNSPTGFGIGVVIDAITILDQPSAYVTAHGTVPLIVGHNSDEELARTSGQFGLSVDGTTVQDMVDQFFNNTWGLYYPSPSHSDFLAFMTLYPIQDQLKPQPLVARYADPFHAMVAYFTDDLEGCTMGEMANGAAQNGSNPVYRYVMTRQQPSPYFPYPAAMHMLQDYYLTGFRNWGGVNGAGWDANTPAEFLLSAQMTQYWANFAATGNPNGPGLPNWPQYEPGTAAQIQFDTPITTGQGYHAAECAFLQPFMDAYLPMPAWAASGTFDFDELSQLDLCGNFPTPPFPPYPECSTAGYEPFPSGP
jgi:para-nitrobenzyl esterase